jgi:hypothetical protein
MQQRKEAARMGWVLCVESNSVDTVWYRVFFSGSAEVSSIKKSAWNACREKWVLDTSWAFSQGQRKIHIFCTAQRSQFASAIKRGILLNSIHKFSFYLTVNTLLQHYKDRSVNALRRMTTKAVVLWNIQISLMLVGGTHNYRCTAKGKKQ